MRIVVVDDDPIATEIISARLEDAGYEVMVTNETNGAIAFIEQAAPALILMDVAMPGMSGDALVKLIRDAPAVAAIPVVFHASRDLASLQALAERCGADGALAKVEDDAQFTMQFQRLARRLVPA